MLGPPCSTSKAIGIQAHSLEHLVRQCMQGRLLTCCQVVVHYLQDSMYELLHAIVYSYHEVGR